MFTIKNAVKNIYRYKSKYLMFGVLYLVLILAASVCMNIFVQMGRVTDNIIKEYASAVRFQKMTKYEPGEIPDFSKRPPRFTKDEFTAFKDLDFVADVKFLGYNFSTRYAKSYIIDPESREPTGPKPELHIDGTVIPLDTVFNTNIDIIGYNMSLLHLSMFDFTLESGRMFENDGEAVIAKNLENRFSEDWNSLDLGDMIVIRDGDFYAEFTVVGILEPNPAASPNLAKQIIFTTFASVEQFDAIATDEAGSIGLGGARSGAMATTIEGRDFFRTGYDALIYLNSHEILKDLNSETLFPMSLWAEPVFPDHETIASLTKGMQDNAGIFMLITLLIIVCLTVFSTLLLLKSRQYEIAVLRSAGMKKSSLIINYLIENLAFIWGIAVVSLIAAQFATPTFINRVFEGMRDLVSGEMFGNLTRGANLELWQNIGLVFAGTTVVVMLSLILACINIVRFEPLKIFNKRY
ncbi:MAG: FtsX-like permease family protein [Firmicutes bacterium]|nr:FtsX-like permease family protein [Bacillota bacterium]